MTELIKITANEQGLDMVSARDLYEFLEIKTKFTDWIKSRIDKYGFIENQDFVIYSENSEKIERGRPEIDYALTVGTAKELAMVEANDKGKQARQYFIECERRAQGWGPIATLAKINSELRFEIDQLKHRLGEGPKPESPVLVISGRHNFGRDTTTPDLIKEHFSIAKPEDEDALFLSATEILWYLKDVAEYRFNTKKIGSHMLLLGFKQAVKAVNGYNKRGYYVISPNYKLVNAEWK